MRTEEEEIKNMLQKLELREEFLKTVVGIFHPIYDDWLELRPELEGLKGAPTKKLTAFEACLAIPETDAATRLRLYQNYEVINSDDPQAVKAFLEDIIKETQDAAPKLKGRKNTAARVKNATLNEEARLALKLVRREAKAC